MKIKTYLDHALFDTEGDFNVFEVSDAWFLLEIMRYFQNKVAIINQEGELWLVELCLIEV